MKNWKTTVCGVIAAAAGGVAAANIDPAITKIAMIIGTIATAAIGFFAKDSNVTGGTVKQ